MESRYASLGLMLPSMSERDVQRELTALDRNLFLDKECDLNTGAIFYSVKYIANHDQRDRDVVVVDWRDEDDYPRELDAGVLTAVKRSMSEGPASLEKIVKANDALREQRERESKENYRALVQEWERYESPVYSGVLRRGVGLRQARDRQRAAGRKV